MKEYKLTDEELKLIRNWKTFEDKIVLFENKVNLDVFVELYNVKENNEALRLIKHFRNDYCNGKVKPFVSYLTTEQYNDTVVYILKL